VLGFNFQVWRYIPFFVAGVFNLLQYGLFALTRICTEGKNDANCAIVLYASSRFIIDYCVHQISLKISEQLAKNTFGIWCNMLSVSLHLVNTQSATEIFFFS